MKLIIPMAGMGKRMRPHTLTIPKPLIKIAGKPIVQRLVEMLAQSSNQPIEEIAFIVGKFDEATLTMLKEVSDRLDIPASFYQQSEPLGTAHAIYCAQEALKGSVIIAFADTLFYASLTIQPHHEALVWTHQVKDPSQYGVVIQNGSFITDFIEKPQQPISNKAIIGIYYFRDTSLLVSELEHYLNTHKRHQGEYQFTDVLKNMLKHNMKFETVEVEEWLDCGNKDSMVYANQRILDRTTNEQLIAETARIINSIIIPPCYIGPHTSIINSIIGPHVSVDQHTVIENSIITSSIIQSNTILVNVNIDNSMIGNYVEYRETYKELNIGDFTIIN